VEQEPAAPPPATADDIDVDAERAALDRLRVEALERGRALHEQFRAGRLDALHALFSEEMKTALPPAAWREAHAKIEGLGAETDVFGEVVVATGRLRIYQRRVRLQKMEPDFEAKWIFDRDGVVHTFAFTQAAEPAPSEHMDYAPRTRLAPPFSGTWFVVWGGPDISRNYHALAPDQRFAYDILVTRDGRSFTGDGSRNEDYYAFGREVLAPGDGVVIDAGDGADDNPPGTRRPEQPLGNYVVISHENGEHSLLAHLKKGSVRVRVGDRVARGDVLGLCGNSGNTTEPHIHYHLQTTPKPFAGEGLPVRFEAALIDGSRKENVEPIGGELVTAVSLRADP
jgi:murein DD-endopeptidase MepM/ murein hydrolase activator NlpD